MGGGVIQRVPTPEKHPYFTALNSWLKNLIFYGYNDPIFMLDGLPASYDHARLAGAIYWPLWPIEVIL